VVDDAVQQKNALLVGQVLPSVAEVGQNLLQR
jgi:hypothetical protein